MAQILANQKPTARQIQTVYLLLQLINILAASLIWGIDTLFLLSAGLTNIEAFSVNAFFMIGQVVFEVPTGVIADMYGRRTSYLLGTASLAISTLLYVAAWHYQAPFMWWAMSSTLLGLGFTFFSGATQAWLVDALEFVGYQGSLDQVFARGQIMTGVAMLVGSIAGGWIAQYTNLSVPYVLRAGLLGLNGLVAFVWMHDWGFEPDRRVNIVKSAQALFVNSARFGWEHRPVRWMMLASPALMGVSFFTFYAMQPFLLQLYGDKTAYGIAGLAAALVAGSQIVGGLVVPKLSRLFAKRTSIMLAVVIVGSLALVGLSLVSSFWVAIGLLALWALVSAAAQPVRQAYLNQLIPSKQRATVLSFDSLVGSSGGVVIQPTLGRVADLRGYGAALAGAALIQGLALPCIWLARQAKVGADVLKGSDT